MRALARACDCSLLDLHADAGHHRAVFTLVAHEEELDAAVRRLAADAVARLDLTDHEGRHPRLGVVDVVPFVPVALAPDPLPRRPSPSSIRARDRYARWMGSTLAVPCFLYGPVTDAASGTGPLPVGPTISTGSIADSLVRTLPEVRRRAFKDLAPDAGPPVPHPTAGATAVGARPPLVAYNLWVEGIDLAGARAVASRLRRPQVRTLAFELPDGLQISCNLVDPGVVGPAQVYDEAGAALADSGARVLRAELVGLLPDTVLRSVPARRWKELGIDASSTIEARIEESSGGRPVSGRWWA